MARVLISVPEAFLKDVDKMADHENRTRSELIREALRLYMKKNPITTYDLKQEALKGATIAHRSIF